MSARDARGPEETMPGVFHVLATAALVVAAAIPGTALGQLRGTEAPVGGPSGNFLGPPSGNAGDFLGTWHLAWDGPIDARCPCRGTLRIEVNADGNFIGYWRGNGPTAMLHGDMGFDQNVWTGEFKMLDDTSDFPMKGNFRLEARNATTLTGSWRPRGTAVSFRWTATR
jgi:hypothetical protein